MGESAFRGCDSVLPIHPAHLTSNVSYTPNMVVTRSSTRSHRAPKGPTKALTTAQKSVASSWRLNTRTTRQAESGAMAREASAAEQDQPPSPPTRKYTPPRRSARRQSHAKSVASIATNHPEHDEVLEGDEKSQNDEELQSDEELEAADVQEQVDRAKPFYTICSLSVY